MSDKELRPIEKLARADHVSDMDDLAADQYPVYLSDIFPEGIESEVVKTSRQNEIFTPEELASAKENESSADSAQALVNAVQTLTQADSPEVFDVVINGIPARERTLRLKAKDGGIIRELILRCYPNGSRDEGAPIVSIDSIRLAVEKTRVSEFKGQTAIVADDLTISDSNKAYVRRWNKVVTPYSSDESFKDKETEFSAERPATEDEVNETLDLIALMVRRSEEKTAT